MFNRRLIVAAFLTILTLLLLVGCGTPEQQAQKLYDQGRYQDVVVKFPDLPIAAKAREKIAETMFERGDYARVIEFFPDSPYAVQAKNKVAEGMFNQGQLQEVIAQYPDSPAAKMAKSKLANDLLTQAQAEKDKKAQMSLYEQICKEYPGTEAAMTAEKAMAPPESAKKGAKK